MKFEKVLIAIILTLLVFEVGVEMGRRAEREKNAMIKKMMEGK